MDCKTNYLTPWNRIFKIGQMRERSTLTCRVPVRIICRSAKAEAIRATLSAHLTGANASRQHAQCHRQWRQLSAVQLPA
jgi:hypothetical protein